MARILIALVVGVLFGVIATLLLRPVPPALPDLGDLRPSVTPTAPSTDAAVVSAAAREGGPDFYRRLADANASELAAMIAQAAAEPSSTDRELALAVLLKRYSELDALGAVRLAREASVGGMALSAAYGAWARAAPGQALAALSTVENPDAAATVAIALIAALGNDAAAVGRVAAVLAAREEDEPFAGVTPTPAITPVGSGFVAPRSALGLTAQQWAELDPRRALAVAREVGDERLRLALESAALRVLARIAPDEAFAHLATVGTESQQLAVLGGTLVELARANPEQVLTLVSQYPEDLRRFVERTALQRLAERDPLTAVRYLERMPLGEERQAFTQLIARSYGKHDVAAALAWARSLPGRDNLVAAVIGGVAELDPHRALDVALELAAPAERMRAVQYVVMMGARDDAAAEAIANRLLTSDDPELQESVGAMLVSSWSRRSPESAMRWLLANGQNASPNVFMELGQQLAARDPRNAIAQSGQIPAAARESWINGVAQGYAQNDPQGAIDWLAQFRAEPWYDRAATAVAMSVAQRDGATAARLIDDLGPERTGMQAQQLANTVATNWANHDPAAAADWAMDRRTEPERTTAVRNVVGIWSNQDPVAARQWTLRLPQGASRDGALTAVLTTTAFRRSGGLDTSVLSAFSSDSARQQAVLQVVQGLAYRDPVGARGVVDTYLTDPSSRAQGERMLDAARNAPTENRITFGVSN